MFAGRAGKQLLTPSLTSVSLGSKDVQDTLWGALMKLEVSEGGRAARSLELGFGSLCLRTVAVSVSTYSKVHCNVNRSGK